MCLISWELERLGWYLCVQRWRGRHFCFSFPVLWDYITWLDCVNKREQMRMLQCRVLSRWLFVLGQIITKLWLLPIYTIIVFGQKLHVPSTFLWIKRVFPFRSCTQFFLLLHCLIPSLSVQFSLVSFIDKEIRLYIFSLLCPVRLLLCQFTTQIGWCVFCD